MDLELGAAAEDFRGLFPLAPTLFEHGTANRRARLLPRMARADEVGARAWSEPGAGSELVAIRCRAGRADGGRLLFGQKTCSSRAPIADRGFGLFRTDRTGRRHDGMTYFLFDPRAEGVTVRPIEQLDGRAGFAEIFFDDAFVPDREVLGAVGEGWRVAMSTASSIELARPLVYAAAPSLAAPRAAPPPATPARDVSATPVAAGRAAHRAARAAPQVHGAPGGLGRYLLKARALIGAWGTPAMHRARVRAALA